MPSVRLPEQLWDHQKKAVRTVHRYLTANDRGDRSALIMMPTGTGKTAVIAYAVTLPELKGHRLVLTPWDALVKQLVGDLKGGLWEKLEIAAPPGLPRVEHLPAISKLDRLEMEEPTIFVGTMAGIQTVVKKLRSDGRDPADVFGRFDLVMVDERHYEPAVTWQQAIRSLGRPTALLTATPYRNDLKVFHLDEKRWRYRFTHHEAVNGLFLREPSFEAIEQDEPAAFAAEVIARTSTVFGDGDTRVIVRCKDSDGIRRMVEALRELGAEAIGVHDTFRDSEQGFYEKVPAPDSTTARFWVHQRKLLEGIDDRRFRVVAVYDPIGTGRATVQQIGRVLRNPGRDENDAGALVLSRADLADTWERYLAFDQQDEAKAVATVPTIIDDILEAQPEAFYYDGDYLTRVDLNDANAWRQFAYPLRTRMFRSTGRQQFTAKEIADAAVAEWADTERTLYRIQEPDARTTIIPYVTAENSSLLRSGTFIEPEFGYTFLRVVGDVLLLYDARGSVPEFVGEHYRRVDPAEMRRLFAEGRSRLIAVSLLNTDLGRRAIRARSMRATAIDSVAPDLSDYAYICTTAEGYSELEEREYRRYVGMSRARVVDHRPTDLSYATYDAWLDLITAEVGNQATAEVTSFERYTKTIESPDDVVPAHVLLDVDPTRFTRRDEDGTRGDLKIEDLAAEVSNGAFAVTINGVTCDATIGWQAEAGRYHIESNDVQRLSFRDDSLERRELLAYINQEQAMRVVPADASSVYAQGHFFEPKIPGTRGTSFQLFEILTGLEELKDAISEKGENIVDDDWEPKCVFGLLSALAPSSRRAAPKAIADLFPSPDFVLCTDMGTEAADFIVCQTGENGATERVAFIHAKASKTTHKYSAKALQEVSMQAVKNLLYLQPLDDGRRPQTGKWVKPWESPGVVKGMTRRLREGNQNTETKMWRRIRETVARPNAEREVWLVLGNSLSLSSLQTKSLLR